MSFIASFQKCSKQKKWRINFRHCWELTDIIVAQTVENSIKGIFLKASERFSQVFIPMWENQTVDSMFCNEKPDVINGALKPPCLNCVKKQKPH